MGEKLKIKETEWIKINFWCKKCSRKHEFPIWLGGYMENIRYANQTVSDILEDYEYDTNSVNIIEKRGGVWLRNQK